ncbi:hypothetical protein F4823DRAFT_570235 [Ustulina deusta]|nr:hypothetical protein F4823DRAFT_570235 [Ustulina deusta]
MATPLSIPLIQTGSEGATMLGNFVLGLYRGLDRADKRPKTWREEVEKYYGATGPVPEHKMTWCYATGMHYVSEDVKAPHIVPFFLRHTDAGDELFGSRGPELREPSNALLLLSRIKSWFDQHFLIIVPVDPNETPKITRWKIELIEKSVANTPYSGQGRDGGFSRGHELDGKELKFLNAARPASIFLYFRFIMTLVRIRDLQRPG